MKQYEYKTAVSELLKPASIMKRIHFKKATLTSGHFNHEGEWTIGEYSHNRWFVHNTLYYDADSIFEAIHETRLIPPDHKETQENTNSTLE